MDPVEIGQPLATHFARDISLADIGSVLKREDASGAVNVLAVAGAGTELPPAVTDAAGLNAKGFVAGLAKDLHGLRLAFVGNQAYVVV